MAALVIGAGPAGLMAAEELARAGHKVVVAEAKPSVARKFLMAGKSGLNLTKAEGFERFLAAYGDAAPVLEPMLRAFGPEQVQAWAEGLGQDLFTGSSGRVFPRAMKASPLLRAWLGRLAQMGVEIRTRWAWVSWDEDFGFDTPEGAKELRPDICVLACGGASWARLGSDGQWAGLFDAGSLAPFRPANMGFIVDWSDHMAAQFGQPLKNVVLKAGEEHVRAECVISERGLEGGGIYAVSRALREGAGLRIDLLPDLSEDDIRARLDRIGPKQSLKNRLRKGLRLDPVKLALIMEFARPLPSDIAPVLKNLPVPLVGPRPMDEAISTAGGVRFKALDGGLMLKARPGTFVAGEMLDWEAPTGGYLLTGCLATGRWAGRAAAEYLRR
ncbi:TIGR03862 family flavoprotein [Thalassovita mangrovi]|uniref:TIGR03862 family flavoprotein n=1 Tax=Thalassovita mangrovi TaxID=2692236 RepID=A0A6L8LGX4_9RHOB|nr:TIGR03862 family flavoprotein [Thalassovita mangrovi]